MLSRLSAVLGSKVVVGVFAALGLFAVLAVLVSAGVFVVAHRHDHMLLHALIARENQRVLAEQEQQKQLRALQAVPKPAAPAAAITSEQTPVPEPRTK